LDLSCGSITEERSRVAFVLGNGKLACLKREKKMLFAGVVLRLMGLALDWIYEEGRTRSTRRGKGNIFPHITLHRGKEGDGQKFETVTKKQKKVNRKQ